ncbi:MAG: hypothetical protein JWQ58_514 [Reyranella sp.]|nr:hypothetical protein [Reyranella sp.]
MQDIFRRQIELQRPLAGRRLARLALVVCALGFVVACVSSGGSSSRTARDVSAAVDLADEGVTAGPTGATPIGRRGLDDHERRRLLEAARQAFVATTDQTTAYTVVPENIDAEPTGVTAAPAGPLEVRADGSTCRPLKLSVTKHGHTTIGTLTFCRAPGGDLKPATKM